MVTQVSQDGQASRVDLVGQGLVVQAFQVGQASLGLVYLVILDFQEKRVLLVGVVFLVNLASLDSLVLVSPVGLVILVKMV